MQTKETTPKDRRRQKRYHLSYYLPVINPDSFQVIGHLVDLNKIGLLLDSTSPLQIGKEIILRIDIPLEISTKGFIVFSARVKWCRNDKIEPNIFNVGLELTSISPSDEATIQSIVDHYGTH